MTTDNNSASKKRSSDEKEYELLTKHIMDCPGVAKNSPFIKAALLGLENELKRRERDAKLQKKFAHTNLSSSQQPTSIAMTNKQGSDDDWQDISDDDRKNSQFSRRGVIQEDGGEAEDVEIIDSSMEEDTSYMGKALAENAITTIAESNVRVKSPIAAIALAFHASLRSDYLGFVCTGEGEKVIQTTGFAAPIRELPKTQFLPKDWDKNANNHNLHQPCNVTLRYRKQGTGSVLLKVELLSHNDTMEASVKLLPANTQEPPSQSLVFPLESHINLDSWSAALRASSGKSGVQPAIHYKKLPSLLTSFVNTFDLGCVKEDKEMPKVEASRFIGVNDIPATKYSVNVSCKPEVFPNSDPLRVYNDRKTPTIDSAFPRPAFATGDFAGDLNPLGGAAGLDPLRRVGPDNAGNLMGPNHPAFRGGPGIPGVGDRSGFGMMPRFDPFGPPGGPQEIDPPGPGGPPKKNSNGEPNPDHLPPPNSLGNNMFM